MAEAIVSYLLEMLMPIVEQELKLTICVDRELRALRETLTNIETLIHDAKQIQSGDEMVNLWLEKLKDAAYDAEDLLDEWVTKFLKAQQDEEEDDDDGETHYGQRVTETDNEKKKKNKTKNNMMVCSSSYLNSTFGCLKSILFVRKRVLRIKSIRKRLEHIKTESSKFNLAAATEEMMAHQFPDDKQNLLVTPNFNYDAESNFVVYGRDSDKNVIVKKLMVEENHVRETGGTGGFHVQCIVGMGGIGKTTLAKQVFNDEEVKSHFEMRTWVSVSQNFNHQTIVKQITEAATANGVSVDKDDEVDDDDDDNLLLILSNFVKQKKFLLVLDDLLDEDIQRWQKLKLSLRNGAVGSRVLVTTRNKMVAYLTSTTDLHHLGKLSDEDSWCLFRQIALMGRDEEDELKMVEDIGQKLVKLCYGHPLAIKVLAGLMRCKRTRQEWLCVMESDKWEQLETEPILPPLLFSYQSLPSPLKQCFAYTCIYPKDYRIEKDKLIKLWIAEGFIGSTRRGGELEIIGEEYFMNLVTRSFFQDLEKDKDGKVTHCKMHDLIHDLAVSTTEYSVMEMDNTKPMQSKVRHLPISNTKLDFVISSKYDLSKLRTLILSTCKFSPLTVSPHLFYYLKRLRVLDLRCISFEEIPSEVGTLVHLRYLDLSSTKLMVMPKTICNLYNLQTLILNYCGELYKLPNKMKKLTNLRHLEIQGTKKLHYLPKGIARLSSLRTLSKFIVSAAEGECKIGELKGLHKLQGNIYIEGLCRVKNLEEANEAGLNSKEYLCGLILDFRPYNSENAEEGEAVKMESVLEGLEPHRNLKKLAIHHCPVFKFPSWIVSDSKLPNLRILKLQDCKQCIELPELGKLPSLQELHIRMLDGVKHIGNEFYGISSGGAKILFPELEELHVVDMANLEQWDFIVHDEKIMPRLRVLSLLYCPKLRMLPHVFPNTLRVKGCPKLSPADLDRLNLQGDTSGLPMALFAEESYETISSSLASHF